MTDEELVKMARLAQRDDRMSTGALYGDLADRIEDLEAKLAKAVEALEKVQAFVRDLAPYADQGHALVPALFEACETLEKLKGATNE